MPNRWWLNAVRALVNSDLALAQKVISDDVILDDAERQIGEKAIITIATAPADGGRPA